MGRRRQTNLDLPPRMRAQDARFYFDAGGKPRKWIPLGKDRAAALVKWAELYGTAPPAEAGTFASVAARYRSDAAPL